MWKKKKNRKRAPIPTKHVVTCDSFWSDFCLTAPFHLRALQNIFNFVTNGAFFFTAWKWMVSSQCACIVCTHKCYLCEWIMKHASSSYIVIKEFCVLNTQKSSAYLKNRINGIFFVCVFAYRSIYSVARKQLAFWVGKKKRTHSAIGTKWS